MITPLVLKNTMRVVLLAWALITLGVDGHVVANNATSSDRPCQFDRSEPWPSLVSIDELLNRSIS